MSILRRNLRLLAIHIHIALHHVRQYVNGSLLASKDPLVLESARAPRHHAVGWFLCSYAIVMCRGMLFGKQRRAHSG